jgi:hypothetical protein
MNHYIFDIHARRGASENFLINAGSSDSPSERVAADTSFSIAQDKLRRHLLDLRQQSFSDLKLLRIIGVALHQLLFPASVRKRWECCRGRAGTAGLAVRLLLDDAYLESLPWKLICDPAANGDQGFLCLAPGAPVVRIVTTDATARG